MATQEEIKAIAGLYVAYFNRAPDPAGLTFWINQLDNGRDFATISQDFADSPEAKEIFPFLATPEISALDPANLVTSIFNNMFDRDPDPAGLAFWVDVVESGAVAVGDMVEAIMMGAQDTIVNGELIQDHTTVENKIECALEFTVTASSIPGFDFDTQAYQAARASIDNVDATQESVDAAKFATANYFGGEYTNANNLFTLCEHRIEVSPQVVEETLVTNTVLYWGYNPHSHDETDGVDNLDGNDPDGNDNNLTNEGPEDGGVPLVALFDYFEAIAGVDLQELAEIDTDNGDFPDLSNVTNITLLANGNQVDAGNPGSPNNGDNDSSTDVDANTGGGTLTLTYDDFEADIALGQEYFDLLHDLIFDEEGNSRLFEKEVAADVPVYVDEDGNVTLDSNADGAQLIGRVDAVLTETTDAVYATIPPILTPIFNNGGTFEQGFTSEADDLIVAGRLELLHGAIIDGGLGYNTLEVDAKGVFAQAKSLVNIQHISIQNLPNVYTDEDVPYISPENEAFDLYRGNIYPNVNTGSPYEDSSTIDISRAVDLERLTITEGLYEGFDESEDYPDDLTIAGIRNGAEVTLDGAFYEDVYVYWRDSTGEDGLQYVLNNVSAYNTMYLTEAATKVTFHSTGGGNYIEDLDENNNSAIREMVITGDAHLMIDNDLEDVFKSDTPALIDASANTGGVDLNADGMEIVTFIGSKGNDRFAMDTSGGADTDQGPGYDDDESITVINELGNNYYDLKSYAISVTDGDGNNNVEFNSENATTITMGNGNNYLQGEAAHLTATLGDGDNLIDLELNDANDLEVNEVDVVETGAVINLGDGANRVVIHAGDNLDDLDGSNASGSGGGQGPIDKEIDLPEITIVAGDGGNTILMPQLPVGNSYSSGSDYQALTQVDITTGEGNDDIRVAGADIIISSNGGDDSITLLGIDDDYVTQVSSAEGGSGGTSGDQYGIGATPDTLYNYKGFVPSVYGARIEIDTGTGSAQVNLGAYRDNLAETTGAIVAKEDSSIVGEDITLFVNTDADLRAASLTGITAVVMDDDNRLYSGQGFPSGSDSTGGLTGSASLTLLDTQVTQLLNEGVAFSTQGQTFGAQSVLTIVITGDVVLSDLIDLASWNDSIKLCFVVEDGASLTLTAEELHKYVAPEGIAVDEQNGYIDNQVIVTDAGFGFDPFNDQNQGSGGGTIAGSLSNQDIDIIYVADGYERPAQDTSTATIAVNSDDTPVVDNIVSPFAKDLVITGDADLVITGKVDLADDFTIDFTDFNGDFPENADGVEVAMTIYNFQEITGDVNEDWGSGGANSGSTADDGINPYSWGRIDGNGTTDDPVRINVVMQPDTSAGDCDWGVAKGGIFSSGVQQYVLTGFVDPLDYDIPQATGAFATIVVCDHTEDLEVLGLQNNREGGVIFEQVNWGTEILMEGDGYANASDQEKNLGDPDLSEVGHVTANFFEAGANALVRITNQGTELGLNEDAEDGYDPNGERKLVVAGVVVNNADRLRIDVEDGDAIVEDVTGVDVERVIVNGPEDVELRIDCVADLDIPRDVKDNEFGGKNDGLDSKDLKSIDGSGVAGEFKLTFDGSGEAAHMGGSTMMNGSGWAVDDSNYKVVDLSNVVLTGVDAIELAGDYVKLIMSADQLVAFGGLIETTGDNSRLDVTDLSDQALDLNTIDVDAIGTVSLAEGTYTVDPATDFADADMIVMVADGGDITATMSLDQLQSASGTTTQTIDGETVTVSAPNLCFDESNGNDAKLILTGVEGDDQIDTTNFVKGPNGGVLDVEVRGSDFVGTAEFAILPDDGVNTGDPSDMVFINVVLEGGVNDVTDIPLAQLLGLDCLTLEGGAVLDITADQLAILMSKDPQEIKVADGETATINVIDLKGQLLDLDQLVADNPGLSIGTVFICDDDEDFMVNAGTTFGGADIVTPTADISDTIPGPVDSDPADGVEVTQVGMTVAQYLTSSGSITGDGTVNLKDMMLNNDSDGDVIFDNTLLDVSGITAPQGTITLKDNTIKLNDASDLGDFEILLTNGQMIQFATEVQAAAVVTEVGLNAVTAVAWCFDVVTGPVDTSGYDQDINTLYITEDLVDQIGGPENEEDLWTFLPGSIKVEKVNDGLPDVLIGVNRVNIFQAFTSNDGVIYDDQNEFSTIANLTLNLEGNTAIGDIGIGDTVVPSSPNTLGAIFDTLYINSYLDEETTQFPFGDPGAPSGIIFLPNQLGNIGLNAGSADELLNVEIRTFDVIGDLGSAAPNQQSVDMDTGVAADGFTVLPGMGMGEVGGGFFDMASVFDADGAERDGLAVNTGTITFGGNDAGDFASLYISGSNDVTIGGLDISDPDVVRLDVDIDDFLVDGTSSEPDLVVGGENYGDRDELSMNLSIATAGDALDQITYIDSYTAADGDTIGFDPSGPESRADTLLIVTNGDNDLTNIGTGATPTTGGVFDVRGVCVTGDATLTITADQLVAMTSDIAGPGVGGGVVDLDGDGVADNWKVDPGASLTLNITGLSSQFINLDAIAAAGVNIGMITVDQPGADLDSGTTLGNADQIKLNIVDDDVTLEMTAEQYNGLADGTIIEVRGPDADDDDVGTVLIDEVSAIEDPVTGEATIDVTNVNTTGSNQFFIEDAYNPSAANFGGADTDVSHIGGGDGDTTFSAASVLGDFAVSLIDLNSTIGTANELAGQTIRFSTEVQADGRTVNVLGADPGAGPNSDSPTNADHTLGADDKDETDTNVVWLFDTVTGGLDVGGYNGHLGRIWVSDELVDSVGGDVDGLFTIPNPDDPGTPLFTLDTDIIKRIETEDLDALLQLNENLAQRVEVAAFTTIAGAEFEIDDPLQSILTLRIDMGGATDINNLEIDNILGPVDPLNTNFPGDDDFQELLINSLLANHADHYLLPDSWTDAIPLPSNDIYNDSFENNVVGDISSGADRGVLHTITINTFENDVTDTVPPAIDESNVNAMGITNEGAQFVAETIYFSDDGDTTAVGGDTGTPGATLNINGDNDVTLKSLDTSDADITSLTVNQTGTHTLTVTGGSPAYDGDDVDDTTTELYLTGTAANVAQFGSTVTTDDDDMVDPAEDFITYNVGAGNTLPFAGVSGGALELIDVTMHLGTVSLGVMSQFSSELFTLEAAGAGQVFACIGRALDDGTEEVPELSATGVWTANGTGGGAGDPDFGGVNNLDLEIKEVVFNTGGQLNLDNVDICITGDVDMSPLNVADITITGTTTLEVKAGAKLTLTVEQVDALGGIVIFGEGEVCVTGESDSTDTAIDTTFGNLQTATVDFSAVTLDAGDTTLEITASGASSDTGGTPLVDENGDRVAQTIIGSANNDAVTVAASADDGDSSTIDVITRLGADSGDIGEPNATPSTNTPTDPTPEVTGDTISNVTAEADIQIEVDAGFDQIDVISSFPTDFNTIVQVASGAEFYAASVEAEWIADANSTNDGVAVIEADGSIDETIDVSDAGGANGWSLIGAPDSASGDQTILIGSDQNDNNTIVDGLADASAMGDNDGAEDTMTGNDGDDRFLFNLVSSTVATLDETVIQVGVDLEEWTATMTYAAGQTITLLMDIDGTSPAVIQLTDGVGGVDLMTSTTTVATAVAAAINARSDAFASSVGAVITAGAENAGQLDLDIISGEGGDFTVNDLDDFAVGYTYGDDPADMDDDRSEAILTLNGTVTPDEVYTVSVLRGDGTSFEGTYTVGLLDTEQDVIDGLATSLNANSGGDQTFHTVNVGPALPVAPNAPQSGAPAALQILVLDVDMENTGTAPGGFVITAAGGTSSIVALSSSSVLDGTETTVDDADPDVITDFVSGTDQIDFDQLASGSGTNYLEGAEVADFATAYADADTAMDGTVIYYLTSSAAAGEEGLLFYDANNDGTPDGVVHLVGVDSSSFDDSDIA